MTTVIRGGTIVTATETYVADVMIEDEKVLMIGTDLAQWGDKVIDATGKFVMPGAIDVHTHLDMPFGGTTSCDDFTSGHVAALHGGTTMHIDFSTQPKGGSLQDGLDTWHGKANGKAVMDYGFHMIVTDARPEVIEELDSMVEQGVTSFKLFLAYPNVLMVDDVLVAVGDHGTAAVPAALADDVHLGGGEGVGGAHDRADVEVVLPVLDRDVEGVAAGVEVGDDRLEPPVAVAVDDVAAVAVLEQLGVVALVGRPLPLPRPDADGQLRLVGIGIGRLGRLWHGSRLGPLVSR